jgi:MFS family permease
VLATPAAPDFDGMDARPGDHYPRRARGSFSRFESRHRTVMNAVEPAARRPSKRSVLPTAVYALGLTSLLNDAASDMIYPLLPLFLASTIGVGAAALGVIEGAAELMASLLKLVSGHLSDRVGRRKPFVVGGYLVASLVRPFLALAGSAAAVLVIRVVDRFGKGLRSSPRDALIADVVDPRDRGRAFGVHEAMDHAGAVVGPLAAAGLIALGWTLPAVFIVSALPALLACLVVGFWVKEPSSSRTSVARAPDVPAPSPTAALIPPAPVRLLSRPFVGYLIAVAIFSLGGSADAFLLMRAHDLGLASGAVPLLWAFHNGLKALATSYGGALADRFGRRRALALGWLVYALVYAGFARATSLTAVIALFALYALHYALGAGAQKALVADLVPALVRARGYSVYHVCVGLMLLPASALFGLVYQRGGANLAFGLGAALALLATALLPLSRLPRSG